MSENKRNGHSVFGKRSYIALALCAAAILVTAAVYYRNATHDEPQLDATDPVGNVRVTQGKTDLPVIATQPEEVLATDAATPTVATSFTVVIPVAGESVNGYAMETLSYNETTRDWRVHNGIDLAAQSGTEVVAAADGEVYTVYEDDTMGMTVVIRHLNGYTTKYASLADELQVKAGDSVTAGQVIGTVGTTALVESVIGPHLHFSVTYQDAPIDPETFLEMAK